MLLGLDQAIKFGSQAGKGFRGLGLRVPCGGVLSYESPLARCKTKGWGDPRLDSTLNPRIQNYRGRVLEGRKLGTNPNSIRTSVRILSACQENSLQKSEKF